MHDPHNQDERCHHNCEHEVVHGQVILQVDAAQQGAARNGLQAIFAAGKRHLQEDEVQHLRERQRNHREVNTLTTNRQTAHHQAKHCSKRGAEQQADFRWHTPHLQRMTSDI